MHMFFLLRPHPSTLLLEDLFLPGEKEFQWIFAGERTPFKELTNIGTCDTKAKNQGTSTNWYGQLFAEKKEYLKKLQIAHEHKTMQL
jgi:hypothetical protein